MQGYFDEIWCNQRISGVKSGVVITRNRKRQLPDFLRQPENPHKTGGCRVTDFSVPGMYYEKVYSKNSMVTIGQWSVSFDSISIFCTYEELVL